ncbi:uncharacterized protein PV09_04341 [Verruconis gallopava]|uniref:NUDE domain-containing protein n=1 Tax=Verruconis gallopava TaxID=253628 RepID=A0A0D2ACI3_9PEZI|nr:uncharacterized protein PV09_04341 [Verruconis gallopava]KIW04593.1 hypothetical protein PV09_04341 [Verruconis gallopava]
MASDVGTSSPAPPKDFGSKDDELEWYRTNYVAMAEELRDYQETSREVEQTMEQELEAAEAEKRRYQEKYESLGFEVDEWRAKHKQAKEEANRAQNVLQKEITTLRDANRALTLKLRDIEVANDDFEKQARHQTSSLEDMESKYNKAIERGVLLEEEIKAGEQERENLRIEAQRLRDELNDLKVEAEITQEKLRLAEETIEALRADRKPSALAIESLRAPSPSSDAASTSATTISSPTIATPPPKSETSTVQTSPPSPPLSETSAQAVKPPPVTPANKRTLESGTTSKTMHSGIRPPRHSRGPSIPTASAVRQQGPTSAAPKRTTTRPSISGRTSMSGLPQPTSGPPRSESLHQLRGLRKKMATLEERVQRVHSRLPAPTTTPPRASPRADREIPASVTVRSNRKRPSASTSTAGTESGPASRLSFGFNPDAGSRPSSRASVTRPSSRASGIARPPSQSSMRTPSSLGYHPQPELRRPRSSISGSYASTHNATAANPSLARSEMGTSRSGTPGPRLGHSYSNSIMSSIKTTEDEGSDGGITPTARRTTLDKGVSGIPLPGGRRQSAGVVRRQSGIGSGDGGTGPGDMGPPSSTARRERKTGVDIGETF